GLVHCARLNGKLDEAEQLCAQMQSECQLTSAQEQNRQWELICIDAMRTNHFGSMVTAVSNRGSHYLAAYFLEAYLWVHIQNTLRWTETIAKVASMARPRSLNANKSGLLFDVATVIEEAYDTKIPFNFRLEKLGGILVRRKELISIDIELLFLGAAAV